MPAGWASRGRPKTVVRLRACVDANRERLRGRPTREIAAELAERVSPETLREALGSLGVRPDRRIGRPSSFPPSVNWDLPSTVLAATWDVTVQSVTNHRPKGHRARWYMRNAAHVADPAYLAAVTSERERARGWNVRKGGGPENR